MKPYPNEELDRMSKREIIRLYKRTVEQLNDAVSVIRCKDCKHWDGYYCHNKWYGDGCGNYPPPIKTEDGFCDWGDRKEDHETD